MSRTELVLILGVVTTAACLVQVPRPPTPTPPDRTAEYQTSCRAIWQEELGRAIDAFALVDCVHRATVGDTGEQIRATVHASAEAIAYRDRLAHPPLPPPVPTAGEQGRVHVDGLVFRRADGSIFPWRGFSDFRLFERFLAGEDIGPLLTERITLGANVLRVFGMYDGGIGHLVPSEHADYYSRLGAFRDLLASRGLRLEFVVFADAQIVMPDLRDERTHLARVLAALAAGSFVEAGNEVWQNLPDGNARIAELADVIRARPVGTLVASGIYDGYPVNGPQFDYGTMHSERKAEWPRTSKDLLEYRQAHPMPWVADEPTGAAEVADGDRRSATANDFAFYAATAALEGAGATFHSSAGIDSAPLGPVQRACAQAFFDALRWVPAEAQLWPYQRGDQASDEGIGDMPIRHDDTVELRSFCKGDGAREYCVQIRTGRAQPTPRDGWRIVASPRRGFVELER